MGSDDELTRFAEAATAFGCELSQLARSLICSGPAGPVLVLTAGTPDSCFATTPSLLIKAGGAIQAELTVT